MAYFTIRLIDQGGNPGWMHRVHLVVHEAGHTLTAMLTDNHTLVVFMGCGLQVLFPLIVTVSVSLANKDAFAAALGLWWTGHAMLDAAPYVQDARRPNLQLRSGGTGQEVEGHDWEYLPEHWHIINRDIIIAAHVAATARFIRLLPSPAPSARCPMMPYMRDAPDVVAAE